MEHISSHDNELQWRKWDGTRVAHGGLAGGVHRVWHRELTLAPFREMSLARDGAFGWDGTDNGARYRRFLADALWSRVRRGHARKVARVRCRLCGLDDEHTDHFLWGCPANDSDRSYSMLRGMQHGGHGVRMAFFRRPCQMLCLGA